MSLRLARTTGQLLRHASSRPLAASAVHLSRALHSSKPSQGANLVTPARVYARLTTSSLDVPFHGAHLPEPGADQVRGDD